MKLKEHLLSISSTRIFQTDLCSDKESEAEKIFRAIPASELLRNLYLPKFRTSSRSLVLWQRPSIDSVQLHTSISFLNYMASVHSSSLERAFSGLKVSNLSMPSRTMEWHWHYKAHEIRRHVFTLIWGTSILSIPQLAFGVQCGVSIRVPVMYPLTTWSIYLIYTAPHSCIGRSVTVRLIDHVTYPLTNASWP